MPERAAPELTIETDYWIAVAFDFGRRRIGLAAGDSVTRTARPIGAILCPATRVDWGAIERHLRELQPAHLVLGIPYNADGTPSALTAAARSFARELQQRFKLPVASVDERWSSLEGAQRLKSARQSGRRTRRIRHEDVDAAAACIILERWWDRT